MFTARSIPKGEIIVTFVGDTMTKQEAWNRIDYGIERNDDPLQIGEAAFLDLHTPFVYFNHSCEPNALLCSVADLIAIRDIAAGEELTFDYSSTVAPDSDWDMKCGCGTASCREVLGNVLSIPSERLKEYKNAGGLQDYIRRMLKI